MARVVRSICSVLKFRSTCYTSDSNLDSEEKKLRLGAEILIGTPGRIVALLKKEAVSFNRLQTVVLDEADVLFTDPSFPLQPLGAACPITTQFVFVTATLPDIVLKQITSEFPSVVELTGPGLHRISPTVEEVLMDCSGPRDQVKSFETAFENKKGALLNVLNQVEEG